MPNKKLINDPEHIVKEMLEGFATGYGELVEKLPDSSVIVRKNKKKAGKVGLTIGNGAGHEPAVIGWVGEGMLDANAVGDVFAAPGADTIAEAVKASDRGNGVVLLVSNHSGDVLNAEMAVDLLAGEDIKVEPVILYDDIASAPKGQEEERRGAVGTIFNYKITGAYAEEEEEIEKVKQMAERVRDNTRSLSIAVEAGNSPVDGEKMFELPDDEVEIGMGVHGEVASGRTKMKPAAEIAEEMLTALLEDLEVESEEELLVIVNGNGGTTLMELLIFYRQVAQLAEERGIKIYKPLIGEFITTQEMKGASLSICRAKEEFKPLWAASTEAPYFLW